MKPPSHATVVAYLALLVAMSGTAAAATGQPFILGKRNSESRPSTLTSSQGPALKLQVRADRPPMAVNSTARVSRLNADYLDGLSSSDLQKKLEVKVVTQPTSAYTNSAQCPSGWIALGGGYSNDEVPPAGETIRVDRSAPYYGITGRPTGWSVWAERSDFEDYQHTIYVVCAR